MKLAPLVITMMLVAFIGPTLVTKMLGSGQFSSEQGASTAGASRTNPQSARATTERVDAEDEEDAAERDGEDDEVYAGRAVARRDSSGHFTFNAVMNGADVPVLVDTGASAVAINTSTAEAMGILPDETAPSVMVNTANGKIRAYPVMIEEIIIDDIVVNNVQGMVLDDEALSDTLLGMSFLNKLERFEIDGETLTLTQ